MIYLNEAAAREAAVALTAQFNEPHVAVLLKLRGWTVWTQACLDAHRASREAFKVKGY